MRCLTFEAWKLSAPTSGHDCLRSELWGDGASGCSDDVIKFWLMVKMAIVQLRSVTARYGFLVSDKAENSESVPEEPELIVRGLWFCLTEFSSRTAQSSTLSMSSI